MNDLIKIALVDDEPLFLEGLKLIFENEIKIRVVASFNSAHDFLEHLPNCSKENFPEIALIDIQMKPMSGFELTEQLRVEFPSLKVIVLSSYYKDSFLGYMVKLGVSSFVPKNANSRILVEAIQSVQSTGVYFTAKDHQMLTSYMNGNVKKPSFVQSESLSEREVEVLKLVCMELTNQEIADKLYISKRTVESHRQRILDKVGAKNTVGLVIFAISNEILPIQHLSKYG